MLEMLKSRKEQLQAQGKKGFTLMEMLIVIAIIAILIAIAIPVFTAQLNNAKHSADESNARAMYAIAMADYMDNGAYDNTYTNASTTATGATATIVDSEGVTQTFQFSDLSTVAVTTGTAAPTVTLTSSGFDTMTWPGTATQQTP